MTQAQGCCDSNFRFHWCIKENAHILHQNRKQYLDKLGLEGTASIWIPKRRNLRLPISRIWWIRLHSLLMLVSVYRFANGAERRYRKRRDLWKQHVRVVCLFIVIAQIEKFCVSVPIVQPILISYIISDLFYKTVLRVTRDMRYYCESSTNQ